MSFLHGEGLPESLPGEPKERIKRAVANNQPHMAMHYMLAIFDDLYAELDELKKKTEAKPVTKKASSTSKAAKKTAAKKEPDTSDAE